MNINLSILSSQDKIEIDKDIEFPLDYYEKSDIDCLENIHVKGYFYQNDIDEYLCNVNITGVMKLMDTVTLEPISYKIDINVNDNLDQFLAKSENTLDLLEFLWENIVLEVPIRHTNCENASLSGENWILNGKSEDDIDPRMQKLYEIYKGGEDNGSSF